MDDDDEEEVVHQNEFNFQGNGLKLFSFVGT